MFERFAKDVRRSVERAVDEAQALDSATVEAEHLLLALAADEPSPVVRLLADSGLDHAGLQAALERETERSLAAVGVVVGDFVLSERSSPPRHRPRFAASAKRALERTLGEALAQSDRSITSQHLLVGILRADNGTVPRALAAVEVDRIALLVGAERLLG